MKWIESYLDDKSFAEVDKKRISFSIKIITLITVVLFSFLTIYRLLFLPGTNIADYLLWFMIGVTIIMNVSARMDKIHLAAFLYVIIQWIVLTIMAWKFEGVRDIALVGYIVCILIAFNITSYGQSHVVFLISLISVWALVYAENNQIITPKIDTTLNYGIEYTFVLAFVMTLLVIYRRNHFFYFNSLQKEFKGKISAERSLRESESLIRSISNNLSGSMIYQIILKSDGTREFTYLSDSVKQLYGITPEEGMADASLIYKRTHEDDIESIIKAEEEAAKSLSVLRREVRINDPSGETRWSSIVSTPRKMDDGTICFDGIEFDITDQKHAEESLRSSEQKTRALFDMSFGFIGLLNTEGLLIDANKTALEFAGVQMSDVKDKPFWETPWWSHSVETQNQIKEAIKRAANGEFVKVDTTQMAKDGTLHSIDFTLKPVLDENGQISFLIPEGHDITKIKMAVATLNESKERFETLSSITTEGLMIHKEGIIIDSNQTFAKMAGYSIPDDLIGKKAIDSVPFTAESKIVVLNHFLNNSDETFNVELKNLNDKIIQAETRGVEITYKGHKVSLVYMRDISDRIKAEKELEKYQNHLEILVKERTEELDAANEELNTSNKVLYEQREELQASLSRLQEAHIKLVQAEKMASLGVLAAGVAHEINNPLNFIQGGAIYIETYFKDNLPEIYEEVKPVIEGINTGVKRAAIIVRSLNQYSRSDDMPYSNCNLHDIIENCLMILNNQLKNRVEVQKQYTEEQYTLEGNEGKLHQVFLNILSNASQAIDDKGIVTIHTKVMKDDIQISITDDGHGISRENSKKVFDPFFTTKEPGKGTGLGLSITYNIIQEHNGTIDLKSQVGAGTKVIIKLPLKQDSRK